MDIRGVVRARRLTPTTRQPDGDSLFALALNEMIVPTFLSGTAPIAAPDQILFIIGDFKGDLLMTDP